MWSGGFSSNARVPCIAKILPISALAPTNFLETLDRLDPHEVLRHLVAKLTLNAQPQRRAVGNVQHLVIHVVGQDGLRMHCFRDIDAFVVLGLWIAESHRIGTIEHQMRACGSKRTRRRSSPSGAPFFFPIQPQPSTRSCGVICVRDGSARRSASENFAGRSTSPPTSSCQSAKPFPAAS